MPRLPEYLKRPIIDTEKTKTVRRILKTKCLNTVCEGARCPNKSECYSHNTATFLIMGQVCTRNCRYCNISPARPEPPDREEPVHIAEAVKELGLKYAVITSVTRDDLPDGGAEHFKKCIEEIRKVSQAKIEILTPDFKLSFPFRKAEQKAEGNGVLKEPDESENPKAVFNKNSLDTIISAKPDVFNHNIETVRRIFKSARPQGDYDCSLGVLKYIKENSSVVTKSGLMVGLGENMAEIAETLSDLKNAGVDIITIGQYIQPSKAHLEVAKFYTLEEYEDLKELARRAGFKNYQIGPLVRSSYHAKNTFESSLDR